MAGYMYNTLPLLGHCSGYIPTKYFYKQCRNRMDPDQLACQKRKKRIKIVNLNGPRFDPISFGWKLQTVIKLSKTVRVVRYL